MLIGGMRFTSRASSGLGRINSPLHDPFRGLRERGVHQPLVLLQRIGRPQHERLPLPKRPVDTGAGLVYRVAVLGPFRLFIAWRAKPR